MSSHRWLRWAMFLAGWTLLGIFFASQTYIAAGYSGRKLSWGQACSVALTTWYLRALCVPFIFGLARRFPFSGPRVATHRKRWRRTLRSLAVHLPASLLLAAAQQILFDALWRAGWFPGRASVSPVEWHMSLLTYWAVVAVSHALDYYNRSRDHELAASRLATQLTEARLDLLRMQLHPHFLFNTLHAISELMHEDVERADLMLGHLSELLRQALENAGAREVPLRREIEFLQRYLDVQQMRFQDRLSVCIEAAPDVLEARVPYLILQPLVENAVRHGIAARTGPGRIEVSAARRDSNGSAGSLLLLEVRDDGPGLEPGAAIVREGLGLANTRARLRETYGDRHRFELANLAGGGLRATIEMPLCYDSAATIGTRGLE